MQYLNSYFILNISGKEKKKRKQKNSTIKDIERVNYFAHNFSISHKVCLVEKKVTWMKHLLHSMVVNAMCSTAITAIRAYNIYNHKQQWVLMQTGNLKQTSRRDWDDRTNF